MSNEEFQKLVLSELKGIRTQLDENTQIVRALKDSAEVNKAEHDKMMNDIAHIKGDIKESSKSLHEILGRHEEEITTLKRKIG